MAELVKLGTAPDSWGVWFADDDRQTPWERYLDEAHDVGYRWTELGPYGYMPSDPAQLERELVARSLQLCAGIVMFDLERQDAWRDAEPVVEAVCALLRALGAEFLLVIDDVYTDLFTGTPRLSPTLEDREWSELVSRTAAVAEIAERHDLRAAFHPHAQTHVETEEHIERLLADVPGLNLGLDVGHHAYCGGDPVAFFRRHRQRIPYLHLKSVDPEMRVRVARDGVPFALAVEEGMFVEPSQGAVDFPRLRDAMVETGYSGYAIVEQDMYPTDFDAPLPIARRTHRYLADLGLA
jgi:inosose dehydratase